MNRRQSLITLSALAGHALFADVAAAFVRASAAVAQDSGAWQPELIPAAMKPMLEEVVETILPQTDTPGAKAARVHVFVDLAAKHCLGEEEQKALVAALESLGAGFVTSPPADREKQLQALDAAAFGRLRELTLLGFFTSEVGCTQAAAYVAVPGDYRGCIDLAPNQRAWATR
jgi:glucoside 3-dehydrogenase (cytochrome c) hitch-hiker subunit